MNKIKGRYSFEEKAKEIPQIYDRSRAKKAGHHNIIKAKKSSKQ
jgi:hypothetical protein